MTFFKYFFFNLNKISELFSIDFFFLKRKKVIFKITKLIKFSYKNHHPLQNLFEKLGQVVTPEMKKNFLWYQQNFFNVNNRHH